MSEFFTIEAVAAEAAYRRGLLTAIGECEKYAATATPEVRNALMQVAMRIAQHKRDRGF